MAAIKLSNGVQLCSNSVQIKGIDTSNVLYLGEHDSGGYHAYTATEDCWLLDSSSFVKYQSQNSPGIDGVWLINNTYEQYYKNYNRSPLCVPLKKGQTYRCIGESNHGESYFKVFGCK